MVQVAAACPPVLTLRRTCTPQLPPPPHNSLPVSSGVGEASLVSARILGRSTFNHAQHTISASPIWRTFPPSLRSLRQDPAPTPNGSHPPDPAPGRCHAKRGGGAGTNAEEMQHKCTHPGNARNPRRSGRNPEEMQKCGNAGGFQAQANRHRIGKCCIRFLHARHWVGATRFPGTGQTSSGRSASTLLTTPNHLS